MIHVKPLTYIMQWLFVFLLQNSGRMEEFGSSIVLKEKDFEEKEYKIRKVKGNYETGNYQHISHQ